ncbi:MAG: sodium:calcium antiporter [Candidatus Micrarchaeota archaeon]
MIQETIILIISIAILARSSSAVIDSAAKLANYFRVSQVAIGFILLAVATSLPELSVSIISSVSGQGAISAGNVFGSNITNILLILGLGAFIYKLKIHASSLKDIAIVLLLTTVISVYIVFNSYVQQKVLGLFEGIALLTIFGVYVWHTLKKKPVADGKEEKLVKKEEAFHAFIIFSIGVLFVMISSGFVVDSAVKLARIAGIAESFIGATIIALGTSLPELTIDLQAIRKKHYGLAIGDAIGSNMANLTLVLGTASVINPIEVQLPIFMVALLFAVVANTLFFYVAAVNKGIKKLGGAVFILIYLVYIATIFFLQFGK